MVLFIPTMGGVDVNVNGQPFGHIDKDGFFTGPTVVQSFLRISPHDLKSIAKCAAGFIAEVKGS